MDLWKWVLVVAAAVFSALAFVGGTPRPASAPAQLAGQLESGTFVLEQAGKPLLREDFLLSSVGPTVDLHSTIVYAGPAPTQSLTQRFRSTDALQPVRYVLQGDAAQQPTTLVEIEANRVRINVVGSGQARASQLDVSPPLFVLDPNVMSHYLLLYRYLRERQAPIYPFKATAIDPQTLEARPLLQPDPPQRVTLKSGAQLLEAQQFVVNVGTTQIVLYGQGTTFYGVAFPARHALAYRQDVLTGGIDAVIVP